MMLSLKTIRDSGFVFFCLVAILSTVCQPVYAQNHGSTASDGTNKTIEISAPTAVPALTMDEAQKANDDALLEYEMNSPKTAGISGYIMYFVYILSGILLFAGLTFLHKKRMLKSTLLMIYRSPFGRLFYCTRFCRLDWVAILCIFMITTFFSILAGQKAMINGYIGDWYAENASQAAIAFYTGAGEMIPTPDTGSKLERFIREGSKGSLEDSTITNEEAISSRYATTNPFSFYYASPGIPWLMVLWWKLTGNPDWSSLYILFSVFYGLTAVAAYCAFRQVVGLLPSIYLGFLLVFYPYMMNQGIFSFRDGFRAFFCFVAIAILLYQLKGVLNWTGTIVCSMLLFSICLFSKWFRNDFIVLIPFIAIAVLFFHGKILFGYKKKITILLSIILGVILSSSLPRMINKQYAFGHVLYIGLADHPFMDYLQFSSDNYSKGIAYSDRFGFILAAGKAYRDQKIINVGPYTKQCDDEERKEIFSLCALYPYDFLRLALSSSIQSIHVGPQFADKKLDHIESSPGFWLFQHFSKKFFLGIPSWVCYALLLVTLLLFLGGGYYKNILLCLAFMCISGVYALQFDVRHYFYLIIISLLALGFVTNRTIRLFFFILNNPKKVWKTCYYNRKSILIHGGITVVLIVLAAIILLSSMAIQRMAIKKEITSFSQASTEKIEFQCNTVPSKLKRGFSATDVLFPDFYDKILAEENPKQQVFTDFLKIRFAINDTDQNEMVHVFANYKNISEYSELPNNVRRIINSTRTCPIPLDFRASTEINTLYYPIYYSRDASPLIGVEIVANGKPIEILSVERITDTTAIRTQSAFLVPEALTDMKYAGNMDWNKVFWGEKK